MTPATTGSARITLTRIESDSPDEQRWTAYSGRFLVVRRLSRGATPLHYDITDQGRTDWVGRPGQGNIIRVYEVPDIRAMIERALRVEGRPVRRSA